VIAFLTWAAAGGNLSLVGLLRGSIARATPIALGALAGVLCERAGVINIAIEGQFLAGAFTAAVFSSIASNPWVGLLGGIGAGVLVAFMLAGLSIKFQADQIVVGVVLIVFATGVTSFLTPRSCRQPGAELADAVPDDRGPVLSEIPLIGPVLFRQSVLVFGMFAAVIDLQYALFQTRWGLRLRSVGEHPKAADTVGIKVLATRYKAVLLGGVFAGIGGAYFTLDAVGSVLPGDVRGTRLHRPRRHAGRPLQPRRRARSRADLRVRRLAGDLAAAARMPVPSDLLLTAPYVVTLIVVAGLIGRLRPPAADGSPTTSSDARTPDPDGVAVTATVVADVRQRLVHLGMAIRTRSPCGASACRRLGVDGGLLAAARQRVAGHRTTPQGARDDPKRSIRAAEPPHRCDACDGSAGEQRRDPVDALGEVVVAERVGQPGVPGRAERLARYQRHLGLLEEHLGELEGGVDPCRPATSRSEDALEGGEDVEGALGLDDLTPSIAESCRPPASPPVERLAHLRDSVLGPGQRLDRGGLGDVADVGGDLALQLVHTLGELDRSRSTSRPASRSSRRSWRPR
jgi:general nucleoside transport system permease protein